MCRAGVLLRPGGRERFIWLVNLLLLPARAGCPAPRHRPAGADQGRAIGVRSDGFNLADTGNLVRTCEIEALLAAVVITVGAVRRRRRRVRRTAAGT